MLDVGIQVQIDLAKALAQVAQLTTGLQAAQTAAAGIKIPAGSSSAASTMNATASAANNAANASLRLAQAMAREAVSAKDAAGGIQILQNAINQYGSTGTGSALRLVQAQTQLNNMVNASNPGLQQQGSLLSTLTARALGFAAAYVSIHEAMKVVSEAVDAREMFDRLDVGLKAIAPDAKSATDAQAFLIAETQRLGLSIADTIPEFIKMSAAFQQSGFTFGQTEKIFTDISTASKALGLSSATTSRVLYDFQEMASLGTVQMRQLRQVMMQMPGGFEIAARAMGTTTEQLHKLIATGQVNPTDFIPAFTSELAKTYGKDLPESLDTLESHITRTKNSWTQFLAELGKSPAIKGTVDFAGKIIDEQTVAMQMKNAGINLTDSDSVKDAKMRALFPNATAPGTKRADYAQDWVSKMMSDNSLGLQTPDLTFARMRDEQAHFSSQASLKNSPTWDTSDGTASEAATKAAQEFWKAYDRARTDSLSGEDRQRQDIIEKYKGQLANLAEHPDIPMAGVIRDQINANQAHDLGMFDQSANNRSITAQAGDSLEAMKQMQEIAANLKIELISDPQERRIAEVNRQFDEIYAKALYADMNTNGVVSSSLYSNISKARQNALDNIREPKTPVPYLGDSLTSLQSQKTSLTAGLAGATTQEQYQKMATDIENINHAMTVKLGSDNKDYFDDFTYGIKSVTDSWSNAAQTMTEIGATLATSMDKNITDALTSVAMGTKKPADAFREMALSIVGDIEKVVIQTTIVQPILSALFGNAFSGGGAGGAASAGVGAVGGLAGFISGLFGGGSGYGGVSMAGYGDVSTGSMADIQHLGGIAGMRRMHGGGLVGDEIPIVARKGEGIFTPEQMKALGMGGGRGAGTASVNIMNVTDPKMVEQTLIANPNIIVNAVGKNPSTTRALRQLMS